MFIFTVNFHSWNKHSNFRSALLAKCSLNKPSLFAGRGELVHSVPLCAPQGAGPCETIVLRLVPTSAGGTRKPGIWTAATPANSGVISMRQKSARQKKHVCCHHVRAVPQVKRYKAARHHTSPTAHEHTCCHSQKIQPCRKPNVNWHDCPYKLLLICSTLRLESEKEALALLAARRNAKPRFTVSGLQNIWASWELC